MLYKPTSKDDEDEIWLEVPEAALFLAKVSPYSHGLASVMQDHVA